MAAWLLELGGNAGDKDQGPVGAEAGEDGARLEEVPGPVDAEARAGDPVVVLDEGGSEDDDDSDAAGGAMERSPKENQGKRKGICAPRQGGVPSSSPSSKRPRPWGGSTSSSDRQGRAEAHRVTCNEQATQERA